MSRNEWGTGSVFEHRDGWVAQVTDPSTGRRVSKKRKTKRDAQRALREMNERMARGEPAADKAKNLTAWTEDWLEHRASRGRTPGTVNTYEWNLRTHVLPRIGSKRLGAITVLDVERVLDEVHQERDLSENSLNQVRKSLAAVLTDAVRARAISMNPARGARLPEVGVRRQRDITMPTSAQVRALLDAAEGTEVGRALVTLATTGMRIGELLGATWDDVDVDAGVIVIERTVTRDRQGRPVLGNRTKNKKARTLGLAPVAVQALREQRRYVTETRLSSSTWQDNNLVFPTNRGTVREPNGFRKQLNKVIKKMNAAASEDPDAPMWTAGSFHSLRHYFAGVGLTHAQAAQVQQLLGHTTLRMTTTVYGHLTEGVATGVPLAVADSL